MPELVLYGIRLLAKQLLGIFLDVEVAQSGQYIILILPTSQGDYCRENNYDEQDPRCAHLILTGTVVKIEDGSEEGKLAREALFSRHPAMEFWPEDHGWFFCKLDIENILLLNYFGGAVNVPVDDYFAAQI